MLKSKLALALRGGGLFAGSVGLLSIFASLAQALESFHHIKEAAELYLVYVRGPVLNALGLNTVQASISFDVLVVWLATFAAVNALIYRSEGTFLWHHIGQNYCFRTRQTFFPQLACRIPKLIWAFLMTPFVCLASIYTTARTGNTHLRMAYLTVEPKALSKYVVVIIAIPTVLLAISALMLKLV